MTSCNAKCGQIPTWVKVYVKTLDTFFADVVETGSIEFFINGISPVNELKIFENPKEIALLSKPTFFCFKSIQF